MTETDHNIPKTLFNLAKTFYQDPDTNHKTLTSSLKQQLRLLDNEIAPFNKKTATEILEMPERLIPYYTQCPDSVALVTYPKDYKLKISEALRLSTDTDITDYLPVIYLIDRSNQVTIKNPWGLPT